MAKWTRNHMLEIGAVLLGLGVILTIVSFTDSFVEPTPGWLQGYHDMTHLSGDGTLPEGNYNLIVFIVGPLMLLIGGFYFGEQVVLRRRFQRLLDTPKKSEFASRRKDLDDLAKRLPRGYADKIEAKEAEFKSKRAA